MIYNNPLNESNNIILRGEEADSFLESCDITLFTDAVAIGEMVMDGITGEKILAENGITLNENHIVLEGKQAEEYKARKAKEKEKEKEERRRRDKRRYYDHNDEGDNRIYGKSFGTGSELHKKTVNVMNDDRIKRVKNGTIESLPKDAYGNNIFVQYDATKRHIRRHPKQYKESTIFRYANLITE